MHETITITFDWDGRRARNLEHGYTMADGRWRAVSESLINAQEQGSQQIHVIRTVMEHDHLMIMKTLRFAINRTVWHTPRTSDTSMDDGQAKKLQSASTACWLKSTTAATTTRWLFGHLNWPDEKRWPTFLRNSWNWQRSVSAIDIAMSGADNVQFMWCMSRHSVLRIVAISMKTHSIRPEYFGDHQHKSSKCPLVVRIYSLDHSLSPLILTPPNVMAIRAPSTRDSNPMTPPPVIPMGRVNWLVDWQAKPYWKAADQWSDMDTKSGTVSANVCQSNYNNIRVQGCLWWNKQCSQLPSYHRRHVNWCEFTLDFLHLLNTTTY